MCHRDSIEQQHEAELHAAAAATFQLDRAALLSAVLTLTQHCRASAEACRIINSPSLHELNPPLAPAAALFDTIADLSLTGQDITDPTRSYRQMAHGLANAIANIFSLAASQDIDLGEILATQLVSNATEPLPF